MSGSAAGVEKEKENNSSHEMTACFPILEREKKEEKKPFEDLPLDVW